MERLLERDRLEVGRLVLGPFDNNVYLVRDRTQRVCAVIDAAFEPQSILDAVAGDRIAAILLTHAHMDHVQALEALRLRTEAPVGVHPLEPGLEGMKPEIALTHGTCVQVGSHQLEVLHTPGHTPGSVCFVLGKELCFCGDTVFPGGPGKTATPQDFLRIVESIERHLYTLNDSIRLLPGHGEGLTVGDSKKEYELFRKRPRTSIPFGDVLWEKA
ncbi:MAG: MBL fold metallo-hydrolase [Thermodesulfobacteriota bacterium]